MAPPASTTAAAHRRGGGLGQVTPPDHTLISPAARRIVDGALFDLDGDHYWADDHFSCGGDPAGDVVVLRGVEYMRCVERQVRRAVQIRDIEAWIEEDRVDFAFGPAALDVNAAVGWIAAPNGVASLDDLVPIAAGDCRANAGHPGMKRSIRMVAARATQTADAAEDGGSGLWD
jgi:hypothetical protein